MNITREEINQLLHYGVPGMKWGVRRSKQQLAKARKATKGGRDTERTRYKTKPAKLSDTELKRRIERMQTEKKYNELNAKDVSTGRKVINAIVSDSAKSAGTRVATAAAVYGVKVAIDAKFGEGTSSKVFPKKK